MELDIYVSQIKVMNAPTLNLSILEKLKKIIRPKKGKFLDEKGDCGFIVCNSKGDGVYKETLDEVIDSLSSLSENNNLRLIPHYISGEETIKTSPISCLSSTYLEKNPERTLKYTPLTNSEYKELQEMVCAKEV